MVAGEKGQMERIAEGIYKAKFQTPESFTPTFMRKSERVAGAF